MAGSDPDKLITKADKLSVSLPLPLYCVCVCIYPVRLYLVGELILRSRIFILLIETFYSLRVCVCVFTVLRCILLVEKRYNFLVLIY